MREEIAKLILISLVLIVVAILLTIAIVIYKKESEAEKRYQEIHAKAEAIRARPDYQAKLKIAEAEAKKKIEGMIQEHENFLNNCRANPQDFDCQIYLIKLKENYNRDIMLDIASKSESDKQKMIQLQGETANSVKWGNIWGFLGLLK